LSYGVYLWGYPIQQLVIQVNPDLPVAFSVALTIVFTLAVATLSWRHLAAPALGLKHSARTEPIRGLDGNQPFLRLRSHPCRDVEPARHACGVSLVWQCHRWRPWAFVSEARIDSSWIKSATIDRISPDITAARITGL
jgi:hypothetical protein